jgi:hypothetical protein
MPLPELDNLARSHQLKAEAGDQKEFDGLVKSARRFLKDAKLPALSPEGRFYLTYNAAHSLSLAALRWHGYRSENRYMVFQCLQHTLGLPPEKWRILAKAHDKRNLAEYEGDADIEASLLKALIEVTEEVAKRVSALGHVKA